MASDRFASQLRRSAGTVHDDPLLAERILTAVRTGPRPGALPRRPTSPTAAVGVAALIVCCLIGIAHAAWPAARSQAPVIAAVPLPAPDLSAPMWLAHADPLADEARRIGNDCRRVGLFLVARLPSAPLTAR